MMIDKNETLGNGETLMPDRWSNKDDLKRKIRNLKKLEIKIRFCSTDFPAREQAFISKPGHANLVWDEFFDLHEPALRKTKYQLDSLVGMDKEKFKDVVGEYFWHVYFRFYKENGIMDKQLYDPDILGQLGLPFDADTHAVKKRFRELAKRYHPDTGGEMTRFIEFMEQYKRLDIVPLK